MTMATPKTLTVRLRNPDGHPKQRQMIDSTAKRLIVKAGRRGGKTVGFAHKAVKQFLDGRRQLYAAPTNEQTETFWFEVKRALAVPVQAGVFKQNEGERFIERPGTKQRIKAKTAWNANTLRGDYADDLYLDEYQLMAEDTWDEVGAPMLLDNNGNATFIFTPPSLKTSGVSKARDPRHASKMYNRATQDSTGLWDTIHFTSFDNPFISKAALETVIEDMSFDSYRREILAEDDEIEASWLVYGKFNEALCKIPRFPIPLDWLVSTGHDFGSANPAAIFLAQVKLPLPEGAPPHLRYNDFVLFREYAPGAGYSIPQHRDKFKELTAGFTVVRRIGGNATTEDEIRQGYSAHDWPITAPSITRVNAQLDRVLGLIGSNKLYIFNDLYMILSQVANCMWKLDEDNKPTNIIADEQKYHLLACLRYVGSAFVPETVQRADSNKLLVVGW